MQRKLLVRVLRLEGSFPRVWSASVRGKRELSQILEVLLYQEVQWSTL